jgi:hypothetical protein
MTFRGAYCGAKVLRQPLGTHEDTLVKAAKHIAGFIALASAF